MVAVNRMIVIAVLTATSAMTAAGKDPDPAVKIVSSLPRTGPSKPQTDAIVNGIRLALAESGVKAGKFKVVYEDLDDASDDDGRWTAEREEGNAKAAVDDTDVVAYIGPWNSGAARVSMPILNKARLLMVSPGCTHPALTRAGVGDDDEPARYRPRELVNFLRVVPVDDLLGTRAAEFADSLKLKTAVVMNDGETYGSMLASAFESRWEGLSRKVLGKRITLDYRADDFRDVIERVKKDHNPDVIFFAGTSQTGGSRLVRDLAAVGLRCPLIVPDGCYDRDFLKDAGADALKQVKCYVTIGGVASAFFAGPGKKFAAAYKDRYKADPDVLALYGYDAANVVLAAVAKAATKDRAAITEAALAIKEFRGPQGPFRFDKNGDTTLQTASILEAAGTEFRFLKTLPGK